MPSRKPARPAKPKATGLKARRRADGSPVWYWAASKCSRKARNYPVKTVRLENQEPDGHDARAAQCERLTAELHEWLDENDRGRKISKIGFTGTISSLLDHYELHPQSPFQKLKYNTQFVYQQTIAVVRKTVGARKLVNLTGLDFMRWYDEYAAPDAEDGPRKINRAHKAITMIRIALAWGVVLELPQCKRLKGILNEMKFPEPKARTNFLTIEHVRSIISAAHHMGRPSIALAQAIQFELTMRQKDVIGEWVPDKKRKDVKHWKNGLTWESIGADGILRKITTKTGAMAVFEVALYPLVVQELARHHGPRRGPLIINEQTGEPYYNERFAHIWRQIARAAGVPDDVYNMDSRSGGITEATDAGASIEAVRHHATHSDGATTQRYSRQTLTKTQSVAKIRLASRKG